MSEQSNHQNSYIPEEIHEREPELTTPDILESEFIDDETNLELELGAQALNSTIVPAELEVEDEFEIDDLLDGESSAFDKIKKAKTPTFIDMAEALDHATYENIEADLNDPIEFTKQMQDFLNLKTNQAPHFATAPSERIMTIFRRVMNEFFDSRKAKSDEAQNRWIYLSGDKSRTIFIATGHVDLPHLFLPKKPIDEI